jgi:endonuclease/exonuclease/phosphatase family metal-dependent hydrolase
MLVARTEGLEPRASEAVERVTFGWWNSSLSPVGKDRSDDEHRVISAGIVSLLIDAMKVDCLGLAEVTSNDLVRLTRACATQSLSIFDGTLKSGRLQFDTGVIYNSERLTLVDYKSIVSSHGDRNLKIANRLDFTVNSDEMPLHVFVCHWPSRASREETILTRRTVAWRLKEQIEELSELAPGAPMIVMGDFNDEPFDQSLAWNLLATRDRSLAMSKTGYLYNPFWRHLGESQPHSHVAVKRGPAGSCFYKGDATTQWRTFDQMLFSRAFIGGSEWHLKEEETSIVEIDPLVELVQSKLFFDHLPITSVLEKGRGTN